MPTSLEKLWSGWVLSLAKKKPSAYVQIRKIFRDLTWEVPYDQWDGLSLKVENLGYSAGPVKMNQLRRNYLNEEELTKCRDTLIERMSKSQSCITARFGNKEKDSRSQGFCMQTISLNYLEKPEEGEPKFVVELYYRSTEVGQKFFADLMFLDEVVFPILFEGLPKPDIIRFKFSTLYLSSMFLPIVLQTTDVVKFLNEVTQSDPKWFTRCVRVAIEKWMVEECNYNYRTRAKMHDIFRAYVFPSLTRQQIKTIKRLTKK